MRGVAPAASATLRIDGNAVVGYAAPAGGRYPCRLQLEADGEIIAVAEATRFADEAAALGWRLGWCGVMLPGLDLAGALADRAVVRCLASGRVLLDIEVPEKSDTPASPVEWDIAALLCHARRDTACDDPRQILPFAEASLARHGIAGLLEATYRSFYGRAADAAVVAAWATDPPPQPALAALRMVLTSAEYRGGVAPFIPGPFHPAFAFDLTPLDR